MSSLAVEQYLGFYRTVQALYGHFLNISLSGSIALTSTPGLPRTPFSSGSLIGQGGRGGSLVHGFEVPD